MPPITIPLWAAAGANVAFWAAVHTTAGYAAHRVPLDRLQRDGWLLRIRSFERRGQPYLRLGIRRWKDRLPEAGDWFAGGTSKRRLPAANVTGLARFAAETRRAERAHWWMLAASPLAVIWNPPLGVAAMIAYGLAANVPCIAVQRYNRARIERSLRRAAERSSSTGSAPPATGPRTNGSNMP